MKTGTKQLTESGYVNSTNPTRIYSVVLKGADDTSITLADANTTTYDTIAAPTSAVVRVNYKKGLFFPGGCYITTDVSTTYVNVSFETV